MKLNEYITEELKPSRKVGNVKYNHSFTDRNGTRHEDGYRPKDRKSLTRLLQALRRERGDEGDYNDIDVSRITDMSYLFEDNNFVRFNGVITGWDTSKVTNMSSMFSGAIVFNQPIGKWDVSNVWDMSFMFQRATTFNQPIGDWDTHKVQNMSGMFQDATSFNQPIGKWDTSEVENMHCMFQGAKSFNQDLSNWKVYKVRDRSDQFKDCPIASSYEPKFA